MRLACTWVRLAYIRLRFGRTFVPFIGAFRSALWGGKHAALAPKHGKTAAQAGHRADHARPEKFIAYRRGLFFIDGKN
jgi:hypothetical protein